LAISFYNRKNNCQYRPAGVPMYRPVGVPILFLKKSAKNKGIFKTVKIFLFLVMFTLLILIY